MTEEAQYDVFLCHNSADKPAVEELARRLIKEGIKPWLDKWNLIPGEPWQEAIEEALDSCATYAIFIGPSGISPWHNEEMRASLDLAVRGRDDVRVIPVLLPGADPATLPSFLTRRAYVDFRPGLDDSDAFARLIAGILGQPPEEVGPFTLPDEPAPYPGLLPFTIRQADFFFGRTAECSQLLERVHESSFVAVIGASGSGKSSLVLAGLLPALGKDWRALTLVPGARPLRALADQLATLVPIESRLPLADDLEARLANRVDGLSNAVSTLQADRPNMATLLIVVDQFEELFTQVTGTPEEVRQQQRQFIANLVDAASKSNGRVRVVLTMRADFFKHCLDFPHLRALLEANQFLLGPMGEDALREAIVKPAQVVGAMFEKGLVGRLIDDMRDQPAALPLMGFALAQLWQQRHGVWLTHAAYEAIGGVSGAIDQRADAVYDQLSKAQKYLARNLFVRLVTLGEGASDTRRRARRDELNLVGTTPEEVEELIVTLSHRDVRLIATDADTVELAHDALIEQWRQLRNWLDEDRAALRTHRRLTEAAQEWQRLERDEGVLYRGARLAETTEWAESHAADMNPLEREFLNASVELGERERRQARRRIQLVTAGLVTAMLIFAALGLLAWRQRNAALGARATAAAERDQALINESRLLANLALQQLTVDPVASISLSLRALPGPSNQRPYVPKAEFALTRAVQASLERAYLATSIHTEREDQVAFGADHIAVGGDELLLVGYDLSDPVTLASHDGEVQGVQWADDGRLLSYDSRTVRVWQEGESIAAHTFDETVNCAEWRPDSEQIAVCSGAVLWLWSPQPDTVEQLHIFTGNVWGARWSPDGRKLTAWDKNTVLIRDPDRSPVSLEGYTGDVEGAEFVDADRVITWGYDGKARLWTVDGQIERIYDVSGVGGTCDNLRESTHVRGLAFSADGTRLLTFLDNGAAHIWDVKTGTEIATLCGHSKSILAAAWQGDYVATTSVDQTGRVWEAATGEEIVTLYGHTDRVLGLRWLDDERLLTYGQDGSLRIWQIFDSNGLPLGHGLDRVFTGHEGPIEFARWLDDTTIITARGDGTARRWSLETGDVLTLPNDSGKEREILWDSTGTRVLTYVYNADGQVWNFETQTVEFEIDGEFEKYGPISRAFWLDVGLLISHESDYARLIDAETGEVLARLEGHTAAINAAQLHGDRLATAGADGTVRLWNPQTGELLSVLSHHDQLALFSVQWDADGKRLLSAGLNGKVTLWDTQTGTELLSLTGAGLALEASAVFSPDERRIAANIGDDFFVWDAQSGDEILQKIKAHDDEPVNGVQWNGDGSRLLTWGADGSARLWDVAAGVEILRLTDTARIGVAALNSDGSRILTAGDSGLLMIWQAWPSLESLIEAAQNCCLTRELSPEQRSAFLID